MPEYVGNIINVEHFWSKIDVQGINECHNWTGPHRGRGYGAYPVGGCWGGSNTTYRSAHSVALELTLGRSLSEGMFACHTCDNPKCCNPLHLWEGTYLDNNRDAMRKGRNLKGRKRTDEFKIKTGNAHRRRQRKICVECGLVSEGSGLSSHTRSTQHSIFELVETCEF